MIPISNKWATWIVQIYLLFEENGDKVLFLYFHDKMRTTNFPKLFNAVFPYVIHLYSGDKVAVT